MQNLAKRYVVAADSEGTYGTDAFGGSTPSNFLASIMAEQPPLQEAIGSANPEQMSATHDTFPNEKYGDMLSVSELSFPIKGDDDAPDEPPPHAAILKAANLKEVKRDPDSTADSGDEYVEYFPVTGHRMGEAPSATLVTYLFNEAYDTQYKWLATGLRFNLTWTIEMGEVADLQVDEGKALYQQMPTSGNSQSVNPSGYSGNHDNFLVRNITHKVDGTEYPIESLELSTNWNLTEDRDASQATGTLHKVKCNRSSDSPPGGSVTYKARDSVIPDLVPKMKSGATSKLTALLDNGTKQMKIVCPNVQIDWDTLELGNSATFDVPIACHGTRDPNASDSALQSGENSFFIKHGESTSDFDQR